MVCPNLIAGIENRNDGTSHGINAAQICAFEQIAPKTRKRQIISAVTSAMLARYHVVDREPFIAASLRKMAILTPVQGALTDLLSQICIHDSSCRW
jgi:hypothetical protein